MKLKNSPSIKVGIGIFLSRIVGLIREALFANFFGNTIYADAFRSAVRIPNLLQNLFGEGVLSACFIPTYSKIVERDKSEGAKLAISVLYSLILILLILSILGIVFSHELVTILAPGFQPEAKNITAELIQILIPGISFLVLSALCLGILNSHRSFFLPYISPVFWNLIIIAGLCFFMISHNDHQSIKRLAWIFSIASFGQFIIQVPKVLKLNPQIKEKLTTKPNFKDENFKIVFQNFVPTFVGRGSLQISTFFDNIFASALPIGSVSTQNYAQLIYMLPISLFGMSISASELPELSKLGTNEEINSRLSKAVEKLTFLALFVSTFFLFNGISFVRLFLESGKFTQEDSYIVFQATSVMMLGLLPAMTSRVMSTSFYAIQKAKLPYRISIFRTVIGILLGYFSIKSFNTNFYLLSFQVYPLTILSLVSTVISYLEFALLNYACKREFNYIFNFQFLLFSLMMTLIGSLIASLAMHGLNLESNSKVDLLLTCLISGCIYLAINYLFKNRIKQLAT